MIEPVDWQQSADELHESYAPNGTWRRASGSGLVAGEAGKSMSVGRRMLTR